MSLRTLSSSILVGVLSLTTLTPVASAAASFSDVPSGHANAEAIAYVKAQGIVSGNPDGTFKPNQTINRAEFTKIILEATQERASCTSASKTFSDVQSDAWFSAYVCRAKELGVIGGYSDGTFRPGSAINFAEAAKIIAHAQGYSMTADAAVWYRGSVEALGERKAIPVSIDSLEKKLTRGEMAEMIWRLKAEVNNKPSRTYGDLHSAQGEQQKAMSPKETFLRLYADYGDIKTDADIEAFFLKYNSKKLNEYLGLGRVEMSAMSPAQKDKIIAFKKGTPLSLGEVNATHVKERINGDTAFVRVSNGYYETLHFVLERNQWKVEDYTTASSNFPD